MSSDLMEFNEVFRDESPCRSRINNGCGFDGFQTSFGNKSHWNTQFLSFSNILLHWKILMSYQSSTSKILHKAVVLHLVFFFFDLLLPNRDLLLLIRAVIGTVATLSAHEAQTFCHAFCAFFFVKMVYVHCIVVLLLWLILRAVVAVAIGVGEGYSGVSAIDVTINLGDSGNVLVKVGRDLSHHMDGA
jgi:hypothetical protein